MSGILLDLTALQDEVERVGIRMELFARAAVAGIAAKLTERWQESVYRAKLWQGEKDAYAQSIRWSMVGPLTAVVGTAYKHAAEIETGRPARDLKQMLDTSMRVRVSKQGKRYLTIPFRHNSPGNTALAHAMSNDVYAIARHLKPSMVTGMGTRTSGTGAYDPQTRKQYLVPQAQYQWGGRMPAGLVPKLKPSHATDPMAGMVRMKNSSGGGQYLNFRTMAEGSSGWIIPASPGLYLAQGAADSVQRDAPELMRALLREIVAS